MLPKVHNGNNLTEHDVFKQGDIIEFDYTGINKPISLGTGIYLFEAWGAKGGGGSGGRGAYAQGILDLSKKIDHPITYEVFVGENPTSRFGGWNGGGDAGNVHSSSSAGYGGGGATDIRLYTKSIHDRILVAGGGGGSGGAGYSGGSGGGPNGIDSTPFSWLGASVTGAKGGTLTSGGTPATRTGATTAGGGTNAAVYSYSGGGGGAGFYGGAGGSGSIVRASVATTLGAVAGFPGELAKGGNSNNVTTGQNGMSKSGAGGGGGGSSFINNEIFINTIMASGDMTMPNPRGESFITGNNSHGFVRITVLYDFQLEVYFVKFNNEIHYYADNDWVILEKRENEITINDIIQYGMGSKSPYLTPKFLQLFKRYGVSSRIEFMAGTHTIEQLRNATFMSHDQQIKLGHNYRYNIFEHPDQP